MLKTLKKHLKLKETTEIIELSSKEAIDYLESKNYDDNVIEEIIGAMIEYELENNKNSLIEIDSVEEMSVEEFKALSTATSVSTKGLIQKPFSVDLQDWITSEYKHVWNAKGSYIDLTNSFDPKILSSDNMTNVFTRLFDFKSKSVMSQLTKRITPCINLCEDYFMDTNMEHRENEINIYRRNNLVKKTDDFKNIEFLLKHVYGSENYDFMCMFIKNTINLKWNSFIPVVQSKQGLGKGSVNVMMQHLLHKDLVAETDISNITSNFSYLTMKTVWMNINELDSKNFSKNMEFLKDMSGRPDVYYEIKFGPKGTMNRYFNMSISTNKENLSNYIDKNDRRFMIMDRFHKDSLRVELTKKEISISDFFESIKDEVYMFNEYLESLEYDNQEFLDSAYKILDNNTNVLHNVIESIGRNDKEKFIELISQYKIKTLSSDAISLLFENKKYSKDLMYNILLLFNPYLSNREFKDYNDELGKYFLIKKNNKNVLEWITGSDSINLNANNHTKNFYFRK